MSRPTIGWLRVAVFPDRVRRAEREDVTAVLPDAPRNGQYPAWVYVLCSFLVWLDYLVVGVVAVALAFALSVNGVALPDGRASLATLLGLAVVVQSVDAALARWRSSPLDGVVRWTLRPVRPTIRDRLVTVEMVSPGDVAATARPTPVSGFVTTDDTDSSGTVTMRRRPASGTRRRRPDGHREKARRPLPDRRGVPVGAPRCRTSRRHSGHVTDWFD